MTSPLYISQLGAVGDGVTDDTEAFARASALLDRKGGLILDGGKTYLITNWELPQFGYGTNQPTYIGCPYGTATIKRKPTGGDSDYMVAPYRWANNIQWAEDPFFFEGIEFDGNDACDYSFVNYNFQSRHYRCRFIGGDVHSCFHTGVTKNGTTGVGGFLSNNKWIDCFFGAGASATGAPFRAGVNKNGLGLADGSLINCSADGGNQAPYCFDIETAGGWIITGNHTFDATIKDIRLRRLDNIGVLAGNVFEEGGLIEIITGGTNPVRIGGGNNWWSDLEIEGADNTVAEMLVVAEDYFSAKGGTDAKLVLNTSRSQKTVVSRNNTFRASSPHVVSDAGTIFVRGGLAGSTHLGDDAD